MNMMANTEKMARIEELEKRRFYLAMKDRWSTEDYQTDRKLWTEILNLKKEVEGK